MTELDQEYNWVHTDFKIWCAKGTNRCIDLGSYNAEKIKKGIWPKSLNDRLEVNMKCCIDCPPNCMTRRVHEALDQMDWK